MTFTSNASPTFESGPDGYPGRIVAIGTSNYALVPETTPPTTIVISPTASSTAMMLPQAMPRDGLVTAFSVYYLCTDGTTTGDNSLMELILYVSDPPSNTFTATSVNVSFNLPTSIATGAFDTATIQVDPPLPVAASSLLMVIGLLSNSQTAGAVQLEVQINASLLVTFE